MLKHPVNSRFNERILAGIKITTIREKPWPVGKPIMLYNWSGKPHGSPQRDVAAVIVTATTPITIKRLSLPSSNAHQPEMNYMVDFGWWIEHIGSNPLMPKNHPDREPYLWQTEGFESQDDMDAWFCAVLKPGTTTEMHLCCFKTLP